MPKPSWAKGGKKQADDQLIITSTDEVTGTDGDDILYGTDGADVMDGGEGSDTYISTGFAGVDTIIDTGTGVDDWDVMLAGYHGTVFYMTDFSAANGIEEISAGGYNYVSIRGTYVDDTLDFSNTLLTGIQYISGEDGDDTITGSQGDDFIIGGAGNDTINGGGGSDLLYGSSGADTFVFDDTNDGVDTIADFTVGVDAIDISGVTGTITYQQRDWDGDGDVDDAVMLVDGSDFAVFLNTDVAGLM